MAVRRMDLDKLALFPIVCWNSFALVVIAAVERRNQKASSFPMGRMAGRFRMADMAGVRGLINFP